MWCFHVAVWVWHAVAVHDTNAAIVGNVARSSDAERRSQVGNVAQTNFLRVSVSNSSHGEANGEFSGSHFLCYLQQHLRLAMSLIPGFAYIDCASDHLVSHSAPVLFFRDSATSKTHGTLSVQASLAMIAVVLALSVLLPVAMYYVYTKWQAKDIDSAMEGMGIAAICSLVTYVVLLVASDTLVSYTAQTHGGQYPWNPSFLVMIIEASKFVISIGIAGVKFHLDSSSDDADSVDLNEESRWRLAVVAAGKLFPVAAIYAGNSCLVYVVLAEIELDAYVVWRNTTILFNAILWTVILNRSLSNHKWAAVGFLIIGCCLNSLEIDGSLRNMIGLPIFIVLASAFLSAFAAVLNEGALKADRFKPLGIDCLNCLLYSQTASMLLLWMLGYAAYTGRSGIEELSRFASELDRSALAIIAMQVVLGLSVSRVLYYANSVAKTMAGGAREIIQVGIAPLFVASRLDSITVLSVLWITTAMFSYAAPG
jgi:hypothetical protein